MTRFRELTDKHRSAPRGETSGLRKQRANLHPRHQGAQARESRWHGVVYRATGQEGIDGGFVPDSQERRRPFMRREERRSEEQEGYLGRPRDPDSPVGPSAAHHGGERTRIVAALPTYSQGVATGRRTGRRAAHPFSKDLLASGAPGSAGAAPDRP